LIDAAARDDSPGLFDFGHLWQQRRCRVRRRLIDPEIMSSFKYLGTVSLNLALHIIGGFFLGKYIDERLGTVAIFAALGTITGTFAGFYGIYRLAMRDVSGKAKPGASDKGVPGASDRAKSGPSGKAMPGESDRTKPGASDKVDPGASDGSSRDIKE